MEEAKLIRTEFKYDEFEGNIEKCLVAIVEKLKAGQMSVMVGAGFSKNANPLYPSWAELLVKSYKEIHEDDKANLSEDDIIKKINKNPSKVAQDYIDMKIVYNKVRNLGDKKSH